MTTAPSVSKTDWQGILALCVVIGSFLLICFIALYDAKDLTQIITFSSLLDMAVVAFYSSKKSSQA